MVASISTPPATRKHKHTHTHQTHHICLLNNYRPTRCSDKRVSANKMNTSWKNQPDRKSSAGKLRTITKKSRKASHDTSRSTWELPNTQHSCHASPRATLSGLRPLLRWLPNTRRTKATAWSTGSKQRRLGSRRRPCLHFSSSVWGETALHTHLPSAALRGSCCRRKPGQRTNR